MGLNKYITNTSPNAGGPLSIEKLEQILDEAFENTPERPEEGEPVVLTAEEENQWKEIGQFVRHYRDGSMVVYMTEERRQYYLQILGEKE